MSVSTATQSTLDTEKPSRINGHSTLNAAPPVEPRPVLWTHEQYHKMGEFGWFEGKRVELIEGEITEMSPIGDRHWLAVNRAAHILRQTFGFDFTISAQSSLRLSDISEPEPDVAVVEGNIMSLQQVPGTAVLVIEVSDTTLRFDRTNKASLYARAQIPEYWIVDLVHNQLVVHRRPQSMDDQAFGFGYASIEILDADAQIAPLAAPQQPISIRELLP